MINKIKVALIGLGHIGSTHIAALEKSNYLELVAACDQKNKLSNLLPEGVNFYVSNKDMMAYEKFDTAIIATPTNTHFTVAKEVLNYGQNVIVEKPAGRTLSEINELNTVSFRSNQHIYFAFHAACALEIFWIVKHLQQNTHIYGPLTAFHSRFFDPYIDVNDNLLPHATSLEDCWIDSGINALSVLDVFIPVDNLKIISRLQSGTITSSPGIRSVSVSFCFPIQNLCNAGYGTIETAWDQGVNFKCTELYFGKTGWRLVLEHSNQRIISHSPEGNEELLISYSGDRLFNHYCGVFSDYIKMWKIWKTNCVSAQRIHNKLLEVFKTGPSDYI